MCLFWEGDSDPVNKTSDPHYCYLGEPVQLHPVRGSDDLLLHPGGHCSLRGWSPPLPPRWRETGKRAGQDDWKKGFIVVYLISWYSRHNVELFYFFPSHVYWVFTVLDILTNQWLMKRRIFGWCSNIIFF